MDVEEIGPEWGPAERRGRLWWPWKSTSRISNCEEHNWPRAPVVHSEIHHRICAEAKLPTGCSWLMTAWQKYYSRQACSWETLQTWDSSGGWLCLRDSPVALPNLLKPHSNLRYFHPNFLPFTLLYMVRPVFQLTVFSWLPPDQSLTHLTCLGVCFLEDLDRHPVLVELPGRCPQCISKPLFHMLCYFPFLSQLQIAEVLEVGTIVSL